jgi:hypothetical protein
MKALVVASTHTNHDKAYLALQYLLLPGTNSEVDTPLSIQEEHTRVATSSEEAELQRTRAYIWVDATNYVV